MQQTDTARQQVHLEEDDSREIDLLELGYELLDKLKYIALAAALGLILSAIYTFFVVTPMYESVAKLYVLNSEDSVVNLSDLQIGNYLASDYTEVFKTWEVNEMVRSNLGLNYTYDQLQDMVKVTNPQDTRILYITVTSSDPQEAMNVANEYAKVVSDFVFRVMATERPNTLSEAILPALPVSPSKTRNLLIGFLLGMLLAIGVITVHFVMDDTIKSSDDITTHTGMAVLAIVPMEGQSNLPKYAKKRSR